MRPAWHAKCFTHCENGPAGTAATDKDAKMMAMQVKCCVCKKVRLENGWHSPEIALSPRERISYGYCPECAADAVAKLRQEALDAAYPRASVA